MLTQIGITNPVFVEIDAANSPIRIFKNQKLAIQSGLPYGCMEKADAVACIRRKVFERDNYTCVNPKCRKQLDWNTAEMHERHWKGSGGDVSLYNGICLCHNCHMHDKEFGHGMRQPQFGVTVRG
jgi:hypothetical protein